MLDIDHKEFFDSIRMGESSFQNRIFIFNVSLTNHNNRESLRFISCQFKKSFDFIDITFTDNVEFTDCIFEQSLHFHNPTFSKSLSLNRVQASIIYFHSGQYYFTSIRPNRISYLQIEGGEFKNNLWITDDAEDNSGTISNLTFNFNRVLGNINIEFIRIEHLLLAGINKTSCSVSDIVAHELKFHTFFNAGYLTLDWWRKEMENSDLIIQNSSLRNVQITNSCLNQLRKVVISASNLTELVFINCNLKYELEPSEMHSTNIDRLQSNMDSFRQLKIATALQKDKVNELKFHSLEMKTYFEMLSWNNDFWTKLILGFDKWTTDHGQNLGRVIFCLFGVHLVLYLFLINRYHYNGVAITFCEAELKWTLKSLGDYLQLIIPTHESIKTGDGGVKVIDFVMRVFSSLFIYNTIRTSRRFAKA